MADAVWLDVLPSMKKFGPELAKGAGKEVDKQGNILGGRFGTALLAGAAVVATGAALATRALYGVGETFTEMEHTIRAGTGATGDSLDGLVDVARNVGRQVPAEFDQIGQTVADLNTRLGLTGTELETVAAQVLEAGQMMGAELDINSLAASFKAFGLESHEIEGAMDALFQASQATGVGMDELASGVQSAAPALSNLGFSFEDSIALMGSLDKAGLNSQQMAGALTRSLSNLAKSGEEPQDAFHRIIGEIEGFVDAGDTASAMNLAGEVFGTRGSAQFVQAIQSGVFEMDNLMAAAGVSGDTILGVAEDTRTFSDHWLMFKNDLMTQVEPVARRVFDTITDGMGWLQNNGVPALQRFGGWLQDNAGWLVPVATGIGTIVTVLTAAVAAYKAWQIATAAVVAVKTALNVVMMANPIGLVVIALAGLVAGLVVAWKRSETFRNVVTGVWEAIQGAALTAWDWLKGVFDNIVGAFRAVGDWFRNVWRNNIKPVWDGLRLAADAAWKVLQPILSAIGSAIMSVGRFFWNAWTNYIKLVWDLFSAVVRTVWNSVLRPTFGFIQDRWRNLADGFQWAWRNVLKPVWDAVASTVRWLWREAIRPALNSITDAWDSLAGKVSNIWRDRIRPVLDRFGDFVKNDLVKNIRRGVDWIGDAVAKVANFFRRPINWVINTVWNGGLKRAFDSVAGAIGSDASLPSIAEIPAFARGGRHGGGWALVGEEGPELVNFTDPGRVYTAAETAAALAQGRDLSASQSRRAAGSSPAEAVAPMGDNWLSRTASAVGGAVSGWVRGGLAAAADAILSPLRTAISNTVGQWGAFGGLAGGAANNAIDSLVEWIRGKDDEAPAIGGDGWVRPSRGPITSRFGPRWGGMHAGIDVAGGGPVYAAAAGRVNAAGWNILAGRTGIGIGIDHGGGIFTYYGHNPVGGLRVSAGDAVRAGQHIGAQGATGNVTGVHTHFELHRGGWGRAVNPEQLGVFDNGGLLKPGMLAYHSAQMNKPDAVLTDRQWSDISSLAGRRGADDGFTVNQTIHATDPLPAARESARRVADVRRASMAGRRQ